MHSNMHHRLTSHPPYKTQVYHVQQYTPPSDEEKGLMTIELFLSCAEQAWFWISVQCHTSIDTSSPKHYVIKKITDLAQPRKHSVVTRPFTLWEDGSWYELTSNLRAGQPEHERLTEERMGLSPLGYSRSATSLASSPGPSPWGKAWYTLLAHAQNYLLYFP